MLLTRFGAAIRRYWLVPVILSVIGPLLMAAAVLRQTPLYQVDLRLSVTFQTLADDARAPATTPDTGETVPAGVAEVAPPTDRRLVQSRVRAYTQRVSSPAVIRAVIAALRLPYRPDDLASRVHAWTPLDTTLIDIAVWDADSGRAERITAAIVTELQSIAAGEASSVPAIAVDGPPQVGGPAPRPWWGYLIAGLLGGLAIGTGGSVLRAELGTATGLRRSPTGG